MGVFTGMEFNSLQDLFEQQVEDLYDAEKRLLDALPKMADAAREARLKAALREHLRETESHVQRLERIFNHLGKSPSRETCEAMKGLIREGEEMIGAKGNDSIRDAALIAAAQRVEHYEIAGYGAARNFAARLGMHEAARLLQETLDEERSADRRLADLAEEAINIAAPSQ